MTKLIIETARNGFIIRLPPESPDLIDDIEVIANKDPVQATHDMLWCVLETIGHVGSRYDEARVRIVIEHGDKWISPKGAKTPPLKTNTTRELDNKVEEFLSSDNEV
jgi:hypothetical protein